MNTYDAVIVGSGPNGLAAAITLAQAGRQVLVLEAAETFGGGSRSEEATLPGFVHDVCSAIHPMAIASPFFESLDLARWGLEWIHSPSALAHPFDGGRAVTLERSLEESARSLGSDEKAYLKLMEPFVDSWRELFQENLQPFLHWPRKPFLLARFGWQALKPAAQMATDCFQTPEARAVFAGIAAHSNAPLEQWGTASVGLMLNLAVHAKGWPLPRGGSQKISDALVACLKFHGGELKSGHRVRTWKDLPETKQVLFDLTPKQLLPILDDKLTERQKANLRNYQYGPGVFKMDWALSEPIPWQAVGCRQAATIHLGGSFEEIVRSERAPLQGRVGDRPFVLLAQPSLFDSSRAPEGKHTAWAYCHVPNGSRENQVQAIENQIERFAPGFKDIILARRTLNTEELEHRNPNLVGGDISGGAVDLKQLLFRPSFRLNPYRLPGQGLYLCSSSTPPGPGVHGMSGLNAARVALSDS